MAPAAKIMNGKKTFTVLGWTSSSFICHSPALLPRVHSLTSSENNPETLSHLAFSLGLSPNISFYDVYSLTEPSLTSHIPRPVLALIAIIPLTPTWKADRLAEDASKPIYVGKGGEEKVLWFKQTIGNACGSIALIHACLNGPLRKYITPGSTLDTIAHEAVHRGVDERARLLYDNIELEEKHQAAAWMGDSKPPDHSDHCGLHFVAFVRMEDGGVWELEGARGVGPILRGTTEEGDNLSSQAIELGIGRILEAEKAGGGEDLRFSLVALAAAKAESEGIKGLSKVGTSFQKTGGWNVA